MLKIKLGWLWLTNSHGRICQYRHGQPMFMVNQIFCSAFFFLMAGRFGFSIAGGICAGLCGSVSIASCTCVYKVFIGTFSGRIRFVYYCQAMKHLRKQL
jgi:hypothetical protein